MLTSVLAAAGYALAVVIGPAAFTIGPGPTGLEAMDSSETARLETRIKYEGYIEKEKKAAEKFRRLESQSIPEDLDFDELTGLSNEARERWNLVRPRSLGQASRVPGVRMSDVSLLMVFLEASRRKRREARAAS